MKKEHVQSSQASSSEPKGSETDGLPISGQARSFVAIESEGKGLRVDVGERAEKQILLANL